jgi:hypothetical protein
MLPINTKTQLRWQMSWKNWWSNADRGKTEIMGENPASVSPFNYKYHLEWPMIEPWPPQWEVDDCLCHGTKPKDLFLGTTSVFLLTTPSQTIWVNAVSVTEEGMKAVLLNVVFIHEPKPKTTICGSCIQRLWLVELFGISYCDRDRMKPFSVHTHTHTHTQTHTHTHTHGRRTWNILTWVPGGRGWSCLCWILLNYFQSLLD